MSSNLEQGEKEGVLMPDTPEGVSEVPTSPDIPVDLKKEGIDNVPDNFTAVVKDENGNDMVQSPAGDSVVVHVPADNRDELERLSKGSPFAAITWFAMFWLRFIKKAINRGWRVIFDKNKEKAQP